MNLPACQFLRDLAETEDLLAVSAAADLPLYPQQCHVGERAAVRLRICAAVPDREIGYCHGHMGYGLEIIDGIGVGDVRFAADKVHYRDPEPLEERLVQHIGIREDAGIQRDGGTDAFVARGAHHERLKTAAGLSHGDGAVGVHRPCIITAGRGEPVQL